MTSDETSRPAHERAHYDASYRRFQSELYAAIRQEAFGEDIGQQSWMTAAEQDRFIEFLDLAPGRTLLDVACGSGGPALRIADRTGCRVTGVDVHDQAIENARTLAQARGLAGRATFERANAEAALPFPDAHFDAITCIDAINHLPDRPRVLADWTRLLKPGGRMLFTDPVVVTGPLTSSELASRSAIGFFLFVPPSFDDNVIAACGLQLVASEDTTTQMAVMAERRGSARAARRAALLEVEDERTYEAEQEFFRTVARLAREKRLSRFLYVAERSHLISGRRPADSRLPHRPTS